MTREMARDHFGYGHWEGVTRRDRRLRRDELLWVTCHLATPFTQS
jgi:hypothetical protein